MPLTPSLAEIVRTAVEQFAASMSVAFPARVVSVNVSRETVDIEPQFHQTLETEDGELTHDAMPTIPDVPIAWPSGGGGSHFITWPISVDDTGLVVVCDRDPSMWRETGTPGPAGDQRAHHIGAAVFYPGLRPNKALLGSTKRSATKVVIGSGVFLGTASAAQSMILGNAFKSQYDNHFHPSAMGPTGAPTVLLLPTSLSTKHKLDG